MRWHEDDEEFGAGMAAVMDSRPAVSPSIGTHHVIAGVPVPTPQGLASSSIGSIAGCNEDARAKQKPMRCAREL